MGAPALLLRQQKLTSLRLKGPFLRRPDHQPAETGEFGRVQRDTLLPPPPPPTDPRRPRAPPPACPRALRGRPAPNGARGASLGCSGPWGTKSLPAEAGRGGRSPGTRRASSPAGLGTARRAAGGCRLRPPLPPRGAASGACRPAAPGARATKSQGRRGFSITSAQPRLPRAPLPSSSTRRQRRHASPPPRGGSSRFPRACGPGEGSSELGSLAGPVPHLIPLAPRDCTPTRHFGVAVCGPGPTGKERMRFRRLRDSHAQPSLSLYLWRLRAAGREPCRGSFPPRGRGLVLWLRPGREHVLPQAGWRPRSL